METIQVLESINEQVDKNNVLAIRGFFHPCNHYPPKGPNETQLCEFALSMAVLKGSTDIVRYLILEHKTDVNSLVQYNKRRMDSTRQKTADIYMAVQKGDEEIVELLLHGGVKINKAYTNGQNLLCFAVENCKKEMVEFLLNHGADVQATDDSSRTPMDIAIKRGEAAIVDLLLEHGSQVDLEASLKTAIAKNNKELALVLLTQELDPEFLKSPQVEYIIKKLTKELVIDDGPSGFDLDGALKKAVLESNKKLLSQLFTKKVDLQYKNSRAMGNLLKLVVERENCDIVKLLLNHGVSVNVRSSDNNSSALHIAAKVNNVKILNLLIARGANINQTDSRGRSALHYAVESSDVREAILETLVNSGLDIHSADKDGKTALFQAAEKKNEKGVDFLLDLGASIDDEDKRGKCVLDIASEGSDYTDPRNIANIAHIGVTLGLLAALSKQIALMQAKNVRLSDKSLIAITKNPYLIEGRNDVKKQLDQVKAAKIKGSPDKLSCFDILKTSNVNYNQLAALSRDESVKKFIKSVNVVNKYSFYGNKICEKLFRGSVHDESEKKLRNLFYYLGVRKEDQLPRLPYSCVEKVLSYFCFNDKVAFNMRIDVLKKKL